MGRTSDDDRAGRLGLDPGRPPRVDTADQAEPDTGAGEPAGWDDPGAAASAGAVPVESGWTADGAGSVFRAVGVVLNALAGLTLPDTADSADVFVPTDHEVALFGEAAASWANRQPVLARHADKGELAVMGTVLVSYGSREIARLRLIRKRAAEQAPVADVLAGIGVRAAQ